MFIKGFCYLACVFQLHPPKYFERPEWPQPKGGAWITVMRALLGFRECRQSKRLEVAQLAVDGVRRCLRSARNLAVRRKKKTSRCVTSTKKASDLKKKQVACDLKKAASSLEGAVRWLDAAGLQWPVTSIDDGDSCWIVSLDLNQSSARRKGNFQK